MIYGAIIGLAFVVALQAHPPDDGVMAALMVGTALAVALAEMYSEVLGEETRQQRRPTREELRHMAVDGLAVAIGVGFPVVFFVLAAFDVLKTDTAFTLAKWSGVALIAFYGYWAARLSGASRLAAVAQALAVCLVGVLLIGLKAVLH